MTPAATWVQGARPRTLPAAVAPVLVGSGAAADLGSFDLLRAVLALIVALALQIGVNYANDYSDGIRGTDADRVGPARLVAAGLAPAAEVKSAALAAFGVAALTGFGLVWLSGAWWLLTVGAAAVVAAWTYTGGRSPYGYRGLGEVSVFVFFGLVATLGTTYVQAHEVSLAATLGAVAMGCFATAVLVANNVRDIPTDRAVGKKTVAVRLGDVTTRRLLVLLLVLPYVLSAALMLDGHPRALWVWLSVPLALRATQPVIAGATGRALIPVIRDVASAQLLYAVILAGVLML